MITDHKYRESGTARIVMCAWLGTCGRPRSEHAESVDLASRLRHGRRRPAATVRGKK